MPVISTPNLCKCIMGCFFWRGCQFTYNLLSIACDFYLYICQVQFAWISTITNHLCKYYSHVFILPVILPASRGPLYLKLLHHSQYLSKLLLPLIQYSLFQYLQYDFFLFIFSYQPFFKLCHYYPSSMPFIMVYPK